MYEADDRIQAEIYCDVGDYEDIKRHVLEINKMMPIYKNIYKIHFRDEAFEKTASGKNKR